ncbi:hypothetical protein BKA57DRAFT_511697 [Linnemannia elongata]|nr:hypothetical protein BKA57DRAFT_511697 [Linnemannia elongata]
MPVAAAAAATGASAASCTVPISPLVLERHEDWGQGLKMGSLLGPMLQTGAAVTTGTPAGGSDALDVSGGGDRESSTVQVAHAGPVEPQMERIGPTPRHHPKDMLTEWSAVFRTPQSIAKPVLHKLLATWRRGP